MTERKFDIVKMILAFCLAAIVGPIISKAFTSFDAHHAALAESRARALVLHDRLIEAGANRVFWARRILQKINTEQANAIETLPYADYDRSVATWSATVSSGLRTIEKTYPSDIWEKFAKLNSDLGKLNTITRWQISDLTKHGNAGNQTENIKEAARLADLIIEVSYEMQIFINSDDFSN